MWTAVRWKRCFAVCKKTHEDTPYIARIGKTVALKKDFTLGPMEMPVCVLRHHLYLVYDLYLFIFSGSHEKHKHKQEKQTHFYD